MIASSEVVQVRVDKPSGTVIINRSEKRNAINSKVIARLREAFTDLHQQTGVRAVILTGAGDFFSSGTDLEEIQTKALDQNASDDWHHDTVEFCELLELMLRFPKPIIASVNGPVMGSGAALVLASDLVIASKGADFQLPEVHRGLVPGYVAGLLAFRVGASHASRLMLLGSRIDMKEALRIGIYHEIVTPDFVWARSNEVATQLAASPCQSLQLVKQMLNETVGEEVLTQLSIGSANVAAARTTPSAQEGINAFLEKREPNFEKRND